MLNILLVFKTKISFELKSKIAKLYVIEKKIKTQCFRADWLTALLKIYYIQFSITSSVNVLQFFISACIKCTYQLTKAYEYDHRLKVHILGEFLKLL